MSRWRVSASLRFISVVTAAKMIIISVTVFPTLMLGDDGDVWKRLRFSDGDDEDADANGYAYVASNVLIVAHFVNSTCS